MDFYLVLTKLKNFYHEDDKRIFASLYYSGYDFEIGENVLVEENLDDEFIAMLPIKVERLEHLLWKWLPDTLNEIHGVDFPPRLWKRMLHFWTRPLLFNLCCKYSRIKYILSKYHCDLVHIATLKSEEYQYIRDLVEFPLQMENEKYDFQLWTKTALKLFERGDYFQNIPVGYGAETRGNKNSDIAMEDFKRAYKNFDHRFANRSQKALRLLLKGKLSDLKNFLWRIFWEEARNPNRAKCYLYYPDFSSSLFEKLICASRADIRSLPRRIVMDSYKFEKMTPYAEFRDMLKKICKEELADCSDEEQDILSIAISEMPMCYLEFFKEIRNQYEKYLSSNVKFLISRYGMYRNTSFLFYALEMHERNGCELRSIQHGGDYQIVDNPYIWDLTLSDRVYCWGISSMNERFIESAPFKLEDYKKIYTISSESNWKILYVERPDHPYLFRCTLDAENVTRTNKEIDFFKTLFPSVKKILLVRRPVYNYGWNRKGILDRRFDDLSFDSGERQFYPLLLRCNLCICEYLGTTWLEALAIGKPMIAIYQGKDYSNAEFKYLDSEKPYLAMMEDVGILHTSGESAAKLVNEIYEDIDKWWQEPKRQEVVKTVTTRYWNDFGDVEQWWENEILSLVEK